MSELLEAIILGIVQGIGEFLPISSSGHLVIVGAILREASGRTISKSQALELNIVLHLGTLISILAVYRKELPAAVRNFRLMLGIVLATLPLVVLAKTSLLDVLENSFSHPIVAGIGLLFTAALLASSQRFERDLYDEQALSPLRAFVVGLFQMVAVMPGISRSGSTIAGGLIVGLKRQSAAYFSFLLAIPAISGATVLMGKKLLEEGPTGNSVFALVMGALTAFLIGYVSLRFLLRIVTARKLHWFAWYCAAAGLLTILWQMIRFFSAGE